MVVKPCLTTGVNSLLEWDEMVMMSEGAAASRAAQKMVLAGIMHERKTDPEIEKLLGDVEGSGELDLPQAAVVREAKRKCAHTQNVFEHFLV
jgi:carboxypeptidase Taq